MMSNREKLRRYLFGSAGELDPVVAGLLCTLLLAMPFGLLLRSFYDAVCMRGRLTTLIIGLF